VDLLNNAMYPSGEWVGYYTYQAKPNLFPMHLTLNFINGRIQGAGIDNPGTFILEGTYDASSRAAWLKSYVGKHSVKYEGTFKDGEILGEWSMTQTSPGRSAPARGGFRIWPLPAGKYSDDEPLRSILEKEIRRKA
jgi:hypothetical protein